MAPQDHHAYLKHCSYLSHMKIKKPHPPKHDYSENPLLVDTPWSVLPLEIATAESPATCSSKELQSKGFSETKVL